MISDVPQKLGRYRLVDLLARGGMGSVYLARATGIGGFARPVALKLLHRHLADEKPVVDMFLAEARLAARIAHRNVVDVLDVDILHGEHLIAMRFVEGGSLRQLVQSRGETKLPPGVALRIMHDTLLGLHAAHEAKAESGEPLGIIHRDVSPANVLLDLDGVAQLGDFGVARAANGVVSSVGTVKGKIRYFAPEQALGKKLDRRVDVFAAGIVLWELLTGKPLFSGENDADTIHQILEAPIAPPNGPSMAIDEVCLKALERDPERRYATADELAKALAKAGERLMASHEDVAKVVREAFGADVEKKRAALAKDATISQIPPPVAAEVTTESTMSITMDDPAAAVAPTRAPPSRLPLFVGGGAVTLAILAVALVFGLRSRPTPVAAIPPAEPTAEVVPTSASAAPPETANTALAAAAPTDTNARPAATSISKPAATPKKRPTPKGAPPPAKTADPPAGPYIPPSL